jgi:hypothetical protein
MKGEAPPSLDDLTASDRVTLSHEFGHLLHYFTTYVGLFHLQYWIRVLAVLEERCPRDLSLELHVTDQSRRLIRIERERQVLSIDDFYYLEYEPRVAQAAFESGGVGWAYSEVTASLFREDGSLSPDRKFWALRFGLTPGMRSFCRIPIGMRVLLEHMATAIDVAGELSAAKSVDERDGFIATLGRQTHDPDQLHYFALTHRVAKLFGARDRLNAYVVTGHLVLITMEIPFDDGPTWEILRRYAQTHVAANAEHMSYPHPSWVFPIVLMAFERIRNSLPPEPPVDAFELVATAILRELGLPERKELLRARDSLREQVLAIMTTADPSGARRNLVRWLAEYDSRLSPIERIVSPARHISSSTPVAVCFEDAFLDGDVLSYNESEVLLWREQRHSEMVRYPVFRDVAPL